MVISGLVTHAERRHKALQHGVKAGCVWVAFRCRDLQRSAQLLRKIIQSIEGFDLRERTLNLRVDGSIPSWLTTFSSRAFNELRLVAR